MAEDTPSAPGRWRRIIGRGLAGLGAALSLLVLAVLVQGWSAFGKAPDVPWQTVEEYPIEATLVD